MTTDGALVPTLNADEARTLTEEIKTAVAMTWDLIVDAYKRKAWSALGYSSWADYCEGEFNASRLRLPRDERSEVVAALSGVGMSVREIAAATGESKSTVSRELAGVPNGTPERVLGADGKSYQAQKPAPPFQPLVDGLDAAVRAFVTSQEERMERLEAVDVQSAGLDQAKALLEEARAINADLATASERIHGLVAACDDRLHVLEGGPDGTTS